jgi:hypothetical protein
VWMVFLKNEQRNRLREKQIVAVNQ